MQIELVPKLCLGTRVLEALLRLQRREAELPDVRSQAELGNEDAGEALLSG
jgi:hypothetical protein